MFLLCATPFLSVLCAHVCGWVKLKVYICRVLSSVPQGPVKEVFPSSGAKPGIYNSTQNSGIFWYFLSIWSDIFYDFTLVKKSLRIFSLVWYFHLIESVVLRKTCVQKDFSISLLSKKTIAIASPHKFDHRSSPGIGWSPWADIHNNLT